jgi:hypothetical protein
VEFSFAFGIDEKQRSYGLKSCYKANYTIATIQAIQKIQLFIGNILVFSEARSD